MLVDARGHVGVYVVVRRLLPPSARPLRRPSRSRTGAQSHARIGRRRPDSSPSVRAPHPRRRANRSAVCGADRTSARAPSYLDLSDSGWHILLWLIDRSRARFCRPAGLWWTRVRTRGDSGGSGAVVAGPGRPRPRPSDRRPVSVRPCRWLPAVRCADVRSRSLADKDALPGADGCAPSEAHGRLLSDTDGGLQPVAEGGLRSEPDNDSESDRDAVDGGGAVVDALVECGRLVAHHQARLLAAMVAVADRAVGVGFDADEVAFALHIPRMLAQREVVLARDLIRRLPAVFASLEAGRIDLARARVFSDLLADVDDALGAFAGGRVPAAGGGGRRRSCGDGCSGRSWPPTPTRPGNATNDPSPNGASS